jgi:hypothetical protein
MALPLFGYSIPRTQSIGRPGVVSLVETDLSKFVMIVIAAVRGRVTIYRLVTSTCFPHPKDVP